MYRARKECAIMIPNAFTDPSASRLVQLPGSSDAVMLRFAFEEQCDRTSEMGWTWISEGGNVDGERKLHAGMAGCAVRCWLD